MTSPPLLVNKPATFAVKYETSFSEHPWQWRNLYIAPMLFSNSIIQHRTFLAQISALEGFYSLLQHRCLRYMAMTCSATGRGEISEVTREVTIRQTRIHDLTFTLIRVTTTIQEGSTV